MNMPFGVEVLKQEYGFIAARKALAGLRRVES
jgi:hypothetical protein